MIGNEGYRLLGEAYALPGLGRNDEGSRALEQLQADYAEEFPFPISSVLARAGRWDEAFDWAEKVLETFGPGAVAYLNRDESFATLRAEPRWQLLLEKFHASDEQLAAIQFDVVLPE